MPRVFISDKLESSGLELLRQAGIELDERSGLSGPALQEALQAADGMIVRSGTRLTAELLENPGRLKAVVRAGVGVDNIDVAAATRRGIVVMNTPGGNTVSTAEHTITLLLALARHIPAADASVHQGKWERTKFIGTQLAGKTLGVIGLGRVGREVARRAAALDVFGEEPPPADHPLLQLPNVVTTPHLGASTTEAQESVAREAAQLLIDFLTRGVVQFAVNMAAVDRTELEELRLYVNMAHRLGLLHAQMCQGAIRRAELHYRGDAARRSTRLVTAAFAAGLLEFRLAQNVNIVNSELLARERGIEIVEQSSAKKGDFSTLIRADVVTEKKTYTAAGTLFGNQYLRLVQLGPYHLDSFMDGVMLIFTHRDVPGLIGFIGTIFGKHRVNIAQMTVGRQQPGGEAIAILNLDNQPPEEALKEVKQHPQISSLSVVKLPPAGQMPAWFG